MAEFKDNTGRVWVIQITGAEMIAMRRELQVNICDLDSAKPDSLPNALSDPEKLINCLCICLQEQIGDMTEMEFAKRFVGDSLMKAGDAFVEAVADFFPNPQQRRAARALLQKGQELTTPLVGAIADSLEAIDVNSLVTRHFDNSSSGVESSESSPSGEPTAT